MDDVMSQVLAAMKKSGMNKVKKKVGGKEQAVEKGVEAVLPVLLGGLMTNTKNHKGLKSLTEALKKDHDGSVLEQLTTNKTLYKDGEGILGHVFGDKQKTVEKMLAKKEGINIEMVSRLMKLVAPLVMGALGKKVLEDGLDADGVLDVLKSQKSKVKKKQSGWMKLAGAVLDKDKDGSVIDDLVGMLD